MLWKRKISFFLVAVEAYVKPNIDSLDIIDILAMQLVIAHTIGEGKGVVEVNILHKRNF